MAGSDTLCARETWRFGRTRRVVIARPAFVDRAVVRAGNPLRGLSWCGPISNNDPTAAALVRTLARLNAGWAFTVSFISHPNL